MNRIVSIALRRSALTVALLCAVFIAGAVAFSRLDAEARPDAAASVQVITRSMGQPADAMERDVTTPIELQVAAIPGVTGVRAFSLFGLSEVSVQFADDVSRDEAQKRVNDRLAQLGPLSNAAQQRVSPGSQMGEAYRYRVVGPPGYSPTDLKTLQDWVLRRRLEAVPGVITVTGWAGTTESYDVEIDERKMTAVGLTLARVLQALDKSGLNIGGRRMDFEEGKTVVRGVGAAQDVDHISAMMLVSANGAPAALRDIADVRTGAASGGQADKAVVQGVVLTRCSPDNAATMKAVEAEVQRINTTGVLPPGIRLVPIPDTGGLFPASPMSAAIIIAGFIPLIALAGLKSHFVVPAAKTCICAISDRLLAIAILPAPSVRHPGDLAERRHGMARLRKALRPARFAVAGGLIAEPEPAERGSSKP